MKFIAVASVFVLALAALAWVGIASQIPVVSVAEIGRPELENAEVEVRESQVREIQSYAPLRFIVGSRTGVGDTVQVESPRPVPENFKLGIDVGLRGTYDPARKVFVAGLVTTKCPSRYEASEEVKAPGATGYPPSSLPSS